MKNILTEKSYTKCGGETIPRPFLKGQNWAYVWINSQTFIQFVFIVCHVKNYRNKLRCRSLAFTSYRAIF